MTDTDTKLQAAAECIARDILAVRDGETTVIVSNPSEDLERIVYPLYHAIEKAGASPTLVMQKEKTQFELAERSVISALESAPDIVLSISADRIGGDPKRGAGIEGGGYSHIMLELLGLRKSRAAWSPRATSKMFARSIVCDYNVLRRDGDALMDKFGKATSVHVTSQEGTDLTIERGERPLVYDSGDATRPGMSANLPCGEVGFSPIIGGVDGVAVIDGSAAVSSGTVLVKELITVKIEKGFAVGVATGGNEAAQLEAALSEAEETPQRLAKSGKTTQKMANEASRNARGVAEFAVGINPDAKIGGSIVEDEKVKGTCHIALGTNFSDMRAANHLDLIMRRPTVVLFGPDYEEEILTNGKPRFV